MVTDEPNLSIHIFRMNGAVRLLFSYLIFKQIVKWGGIVGYVSPVCIHTGGSYFVKGNGKDIKREICQAMESALLRKCWLATELTLFCPQCHHFHSFNFSCYTLYVTLNKQNNTRDFIL